MLRYEERLYDLLVSQKDATSITEAEAQSVCIALEMYDTSSLNYLSKVEIISLSCISLDKKKKLWKLIKEVKKDRRFAPDLRGTYEDICDIISIYN